MSDRLKAWLDEARDCPTDHAPELFAALRAVVELHEPDSSYSCGLCQTRAKCLTIRAIEREVFGAE